MNRVYYALAGAVLLFAAVGLVNAYHEGTPADAQGGFGVSVEFSVSGGGYVPPRYTHYCYYSYYYYNYACDSYAPAYYGRYCDPFDPYYYIYCSYPYYYLYPTYYANPGTIVYVNGGAPGMAVLPSAPPCSDGTLAGTCSTDYPKYCFGQGNQSQLIDKATLCGCPEGQVQDLNNRNRCVAQTCDDGTALNSCSTSKPKFCTSNAALVDRPSQCGCPTGTRLEGDACVPLQNSCFLSSVSPSTVRAGQSASVVVEYNEIQNPTGYVQCGDGQIAGLSCQRRADGLRGACTATCTYSQASETPRVVRAYLGGNSCVGSSSVNVIPQQANVGGAVVQVTSCSSNLNIPGADVFVDGRRVVADSRGEAQFANLAPGSYAVSASRVGYRTGVSTLVVNAQRTGFLPLCLDTASATPACSVTLSLGDDPSGDLRNALQVILTNHRADVDSVALSYSSPLPLDGPSSFVIGPSESKVITLNPTLPATFAGAFLASVTAQSRLGQCASTLRLPFEVSSGLSLQALSDDKIGRAGERVCFDFLARNRANEQAEVRLTGAAFPVANVELSQERFILASGQSKIAQACLQVPDGATQNYEVRVNAASSINDASAVATVRTSGAMVSNVAGCFDVSSNRTQFVDVELTNNGRSGSFVARLSSSRGFAPRLIQENLFNFRNSTSRTVSIQVDPFTLPNQDARAVLTVYDKSTNAKVLQQELCFAGSAAERFDSISFISPNRVRVQPGQTVHAFVHVKNTGNTADTFEVVVASPFEDAENTFQRLSLLAGQERSVEIAISPIENTALGTYNVPVVVYSLQDERMRTQVGLDTLTVDVFLLAPTTPLQLVKAGEPTVTFLQVDSIIRVGFNVTNLDDRATTITPALEGLPQGWSYTVMPAQAVIEKFESQPFNFEVKATNVESKDYNVTAVFTDEFGRQVREPVTLPAKSAGWLTGLFVLGTTDQLLAVLVVLLVLAGLYLVYRSWEMRREVQREQGLRV